MKLNKGLWKFFLLIFSIVAFQHLAIAQITAQTRDGKKVLLYGDGTWCFAGNDSIIGVQFIADLEIPKTNPGDLVIRHSGYSFLYNEAHEQSDWVAYQLTKDETNNSFERSNHFIIDPIVETGTATNKDYAKSGYDRGHLAPAADMGWSEKTMEESFYFSNMSPQLPGFNRGIWKKLEELVRDWAIENDTISIVTGPVLTDGLPTIGENKVSIPKYYYKVILDYTEPGIHGIGFILANESSNEPLQNFAVTIDSVENLTGIDFFPLLPDSQEELIESTLCIDCWNWK